MVNKIETNESFSLEPDRPIVETVHRLRQAILTPAVCSILATLGVFGGIASLFIGLVCIILHALVAGDQAFDRAGTVFLISGIPAILIGAVFLDEIERKK